MVGPAIGGLLEAHLYRTASFHAAAIMVGVSVAWTSFAVKETLNVSDSYGNVLPRSTQHEQLDVSEEMRDVVARVMRSVNINPLPRIRSVFTNEALRWLAVAIALSSLAQGALNSIFFLYLHTRVGWNSAETGAFLSMVGLSVLISQGVLSQQFVRAIGEKRTILFGYLLAAAHYAVYGFADRAWIVYLGLIVGCLSFVGDPAMKGLLSRQVPVSEQGSLQGALGGLTTLLRPFSPLFGTAVFGYFNSVGRPGVVFAAVASVSSASFLVVARALQKQGLK
jgi:DHA1 family tetracycline resistance protein-like MFS transporter